MLYNLKALVTGKPLILLIVAIPMILIGITRLNVQLPPNPLASPESALDGVVDSIDNKGMANLCDYVYGDCLSANLTQIKQTFPGTSRLFDNGRFWVSQKEYKKFESAESQTQCEPKYYDDRADFHVQAYIQFKSNVGGEGQKFVAFDAIIVKQMGRWRICKSSLQSLFSSLTTIY